MFKFNTTTIINSTEDFTSIGTALFSGQAEAEQESTGGKPFFPNFTVKRHLTFYQPYVKAIYFREHSGPELAQCEIDCSSISTAGLYRIAMYIKLEGSNNEYYANDYVFKGKPFYIEFIVKENDTALKIAEKVKKIAKKYMQMVYEYPLIDVQTDGSTLIFKATDEYQRFAMVELQKYTDQVGITTGCCTLSGGFETIETLDIAATEKGDDVITWSEGDDDNLLKGKCGFGTYRQIIKDLRLPTADNRRWGGIIADETPVPGANYDQYTIWYCRKVGVQGMDHVGDVVTALTSHIFFVNTTVKTQWEVALEALGIEFTTVTDGTYTLTPDELELTAESTEEQSGGTEQEPGGGGNP